MMTGERRCCKDDGVGGAAEGRDYGVEEGVVFGQLCCSRAVLARRAYEVDFDDLRDDVLIRDQTSWHEKLVLIFHNRDGVGIHT